MSLLPLSYVAYGFYLGDGYQALQQHSQQNNLKKVSTLLERGIPASPTPMVLDFYHLASVTHTPLHYAAENNNLRMAKLLIDNGAKVDVCCCACTTPLHLAIINKHKALVDLLLLSGADVKGYYNLEYDSLELAKRHATPEIARLVLQYSTQKSQQGDLPQ